MLDETQEQPAAVALPDYSYPGGLQPDVDLYDKEIMAQVLGESSR